MGRVALRGVREHLVRFLLSVLAVTLGVAFVAGTFSLRTMMSSTFDGIVESSMPADAYVRGADAAAGYTTTGTTGETRNTIPASLAGAIAGVDGVDHAFADISGPIVLVGADGTAVQSGRSPSFAVALDPNDSTVDVVAGRAPAGPGELALESATLRSSGLAIGDHTKAVVAGVIQNVQVVGEVSLNGPMAGATIVYLDTATATAAYSPDGMVSTISVYSNPDVAEADLVADLARVLAGKKSAAEAMTGDAMRAEARTDIKGQLGFVQTFMLIFAGISLFVGAFIISNTFAMSVRERMREFALLRAIGASPTQVFASILTQAAVVGLVGSALGIAAGLGLVSLLRIGFEQVGMDLSGSIPLDTSTVVISLVIGTVVSVVAAALPARRAALTAPVEAMREATGTEKSLRTRTIGGLLVVTLGVAGLILALVAPQSNGATLLGLGALALVVGVLLLAPVIAQHTLGVLAAVFVAGVKPLGRLARGNVIRHPRRTANTAGALMIGMALVGIVSVLASSTTASTKSIVEAGWTSDFSIQSASGVPVGAVADVRALSSVGALDVLAYGPTVVAGTGETASEQNPVSVVGLPPEAFGRSIDLDVVNGSLDSLADGAVAVQQATATERGWSLGDEVTFASQAGATIATAPVGAIVDSPLISDPIIMSDRLLAQVVLPAQVRIDFLLVSAAPGTAATALRADLAQAVAPYVVLSVLDSRDFAGALADQVNQILVILYALLGLSIVIAILGIVNTLALSVIERTREIGLMRAVGLGRLQLAGIITIESVLTAVFGTVVGVALGVAVAAVMPTVFTGIGLTTLAIPWAQLAGMVALAAVVGVFAALWPASRAARLPVLDAVASD